MNKKTKETVYRTRPTLARPKGDRWILCEVWNPKTWLIARKRDGHRMLCNPGLLTVEK